MKAPTHNACLIIALSRESGFYICFVFLCFFSSPLNLSQRQKCRRKFVSKCCPRLWKVIKTRSTNESFMFANDKFNWNCHSNKRLWTETTSRTKRFQVFSSSFPFRGGDKRKWYKVTTWPYRPMPMSLRNCEQLLYCAFVHLYVMKNTVRNMGVEETLGIETWRPLPLIWMWMAILGILSLWVKRNWTLYPIYLWPCI